MRGTGVRPDERKPSTKTDYLSGTIIQGKYHRHGERLIPKHARDAQVPQHRDINEVYRQANDEVDWGRTELT